MRTLLQTYVFRFYVRLTNGVTRGELRGSVEPVRLGNIAPVKSRRDQIVNYGAAAVLALITLGVFAVLQDYGPESAIRRFHAAVMQDDPIELQSVTEQNVRTPAVRELAVQVRSFLSTGSYQLLRMERSPAQVRAAVVYTSRTTHEQFPMIWIVEQRNHVWRVDANKTLTILHDSLGM